MTVLRTSEAFPDHSCSCAGTHKPPCPNAPRSGEASPGHGELVLPYAPTSDPEISCIYCGAVNVAFELTARGQGRKAFVGLCVACRAGLRLRSEAAKPLEFRMSEGERKEFEAMGKELDSAEAPFTVGERVRERTGQPFTFGRSGVVTETRLVPEVRVQFDGNRYGDWQRAEHVAPCRESPQPKSPPPVGRWMTPEEEARERAHEASPNACSAPDEFYNVEEDKAAAARVQRGRAFIGEPGPRQATPTPSVDCWNEGTVNVKHMSCNDDDGRVSKQSPGADAASKGLAQSANPATPAGRPGGAGTSVEHHAKLRDPTPEEAAAIAAGRERLAGLSSCKAHVGYTAEDVRTWGDSIHRLAAENEKLQEVAACANAVVLNASTHCGIDDLVRHGLVDAMREALAAADQFTRSTGGSDDR